MAADLNIIVHEATAADLQIIVNGTPVPVYLGENTALALTAAAAAALSASIAESVTGPTYPDTSAGLAATTDGQSFAVDNGDGTVTIYLNDGGVAVAQRTLATTAALALPTGATKVGTSDGITVQAALDARAKTADLASTDSGKGASMIGYRDGTVEDALDAFIGANVKAVTVTTYTITAADRGKLLAFTADTSVTVTVPDGLPSDFYCSIEQDGLGQVTVAAGDGVTLVNADGEFSTEARYVRLTLWAMSADTYRLEGRTI